MNYRERRVFWAWAMFWTAVITSLSIDLLGFDHWATEPLWMTGCTLFSIFMVIALECNKRYKQGKDKL